jgi:hypothetical protein
MNHAQNTQSSNARFHQKPACSSSIRNMRCALIFLVLFLGSIDRFVVASTFTVSNTNDSGGGSLRQAILDANNHAGADTIEFNISAAGVQTIAPTSALPTITDPVTIDGFTQTGSSANTHAITLGDNSVHLVEIDGTNAGAGSGTAVLLLGAGADGSVIRGLVVNRGHGAGIYINGISNVVVKGCFLGTDSTGSMARGNGSYGILLDNNATNATVGGLTSDARNLVSGNGIVGVALGDDFGAGGSGHLIEGNFIGTNAAGLTAITQNQGGVALAVASNCIIGGTITAARNVISGNQGRGIIVSNSIGNPAVTNNVIQGNFIGVDRTGTVALPNNYQGIGLYAPGNTIGGTAAGAGNVISGNNYAGIDVDLGDGSHIEGNFIGTDVTGTINLGNHYPGIILTSSNIMIGGTAALAGNVIAFNGSTLSGGIVMYGGTGNAILGNSIFANNGLGIDLTGDGVTLNDPGDVDSGANNLQNFPVLTSVTTSGGMTTINGRLNSAKNTMYRIEFFANDSLDSTGYGEGQIYLGFVNKMTDGSGDASFTQNVTQIGANQRVTATATDPGNNTSEFGGAIGQLLNVSTRMEVLTGGSVLIGGFIISGSGNKKVLLRALGPTLSQFGVNGYLMDPTLELHDGSGALIDSNDNWKDTNQATIMATGKAPPDDHESAILSTLAPGSYTAIVRGKNNTTGIGLIDGYDIDNGAAITLTNISTRGFVDTGQNVMIAGLISGDGITRVIVRALGPTLSQFGVPNVLADPTLELHDGNGTLLASNDNWKDTQQAEIQASGKAPPNDLESAIIAVRPAGNSTAIVSGKNGTTGNALVEVYTLPP